MRTRDFLNRLIGRAFVLDLLVSPFTYTLYQINDRFLSYLTSSRTFENELQPGIDPTSCFGIRY